MDFIKHPISVLVLITMFTAIGDAFLKKSSLTLKPFFTIQFAIGFTVYAITAFLWIYVYRYLKFASSGALYSILTLLLFTFIGILTFRERLSVQEILGIVLACISFVLLSRFS